MIATDVEVCNQALYLIGAGPIVTMTEDSPSSKACVQFYASTLDEILSEPGSRWNCAITRKELTAHAGTYYSSWLYKFDLATSPYCLRVLDLLDFDSATYVELPNEPYEIEGRLLLCNHEKIGIKYIARPVSVADVSGLDSWVTDVLVYRMASKLAVKVGNKKPTEIYQLYLLRRDEARQTDGMNRKHREKPQKSLDSWIDTYR